MSTRGLTDAWASIRRPHAHRIATLRVARFSLKVTLLLLLLSAEERDRLANSVADVTYCMD